MAVNVRCAGEGTKNVVSVVRRGKKVARHLNGRPCGWKGERFPSGYLPHQHNGACAICAEIDARMTAKPCPRCGGKVEQILRDRTETPS